MPPRNIYRGEDGGRILREILLGSPLVAGDEEIAEALQLAGQPEDFPAGTPLILQGEYGTDLFLLICGRVEVRVNGRTVAARGPKQHVGEMALIDPCAPRSASVHALEHTVALRISERSVAEIAEKKPSIWRRLAQELVQRLRQRADFHRRPNEKPHLFIASSVEGLAVANAIQLGLSHENLITTIWSNNAFRPSGTALDDLIQKASQYDFGLVLLTPDDLVQSRQSIKEAPRDNCIFELGLLYGALGRERTFFALPRSADIKLPSDLIGVTPITYDGTGDLATLDSRIGPVTTLLKAEIARRGVK